MSLGLCCHFLQPSIKNKQIIYINSINEKGLQLGLFKSNKYSIERIKQTYYNNIQEIINLIPKLVESKIKVFRLSSNILPLYEFNSAWIKQDKKIKNLFEELGELFIKNNIRITCHPGQFVSISSDDSNVIKNSITELEYHAWMFDSMKLPQNYYYGINIHGGKGNRLNNLINNINNLDSKIKNRLTLENDEYSYTVEDLYKVYLKTNIPIVFDSHHWSLNKGIEFLEDACDLSLKTWQEIKPLQHISNSIPELAYGNIKQKRAHSDYIYYFNSVQLNLALTNKVDIDIEAKMKNLAINDIVKKYGEKIL